jgi:hypothetical protein
MRWCANHLNPPKNRDRGTNSLEHAHSITALHLFNRCTNFASVLLFTNPLLLLLRSSMFWHEISPIACSFHGYTTSALLLHICYLKLIQWDTWKVFWLVSKLLIWQYSKHALQVGFAFWFFCKICWILRSLVIKRGNLVSGVPCCQVIGASSPII